MLSSPSTKNNSHIIYSYVLYANCVFRVINKQILTVKFDMFNAFIVSSAMLKERMHVLMCMCERHLFPSAFLKKLLIFKFQNIGSEIIFMIKTQRVKSQYFNLVYVQYVILIVNLFSLSVNITIINSHVRKNIPWKYFRAREFF